MKTAELIKWLETQNPEGIVKFYNGEYDEYYPLQVGADTFAPELKVVGVVPP